MLNAYIKHCVKGVRIRSYSGPDLPALYSVQMQENTNQNNFKYVHFLRSADHIQKNLHPF